MSVYIGVDGTARKAKKMYVGVSDVARKVKKAYVGVNGVARLFFAAEKKVVYRGTATNLSVARSNSGSANVGNYALIVGGTTSSNTSSAAVDAYATNLTRTTAADLGVPFYTTPTARVGQYVIVGAGAYFSGGQLRGTARVYAYNGALSQSTPSNLSQSRAQAGATNVGNYALFAGGTLSSDYSVVDAYNSALTRSNPSALSVARNLLVGVSIGDYAIFAGGYEKAHRKYCAVCDAYNSTLTRVTAPELSVARYLPGSTGVGEYGLIAGGGSAESDKVDTVDAYSPTLAHSIAPNLQNTQRYPKCAGIANEYVLIGGGSADDSRIITAYNAMLSRVNCDNLPGDDHDAAAGASIGEYALFAGGYQDSSSSYLSRVDVYTAE